ncbi:MAG: hypothetical protein A2Z14_14705 [Chloroflexi bacterium RBG_16_48_8]|nr:MAG: hypothetical protein A2Z14_14705 [Chloroflexi bacterium RBG_16_48_8]
MNKYWKRSFIKAVVLYPGWFVETIDEGNSIWVLNLKAFPAFIENQKERISELDLHLASFH